MDTNEEQTTPKPVHRHSSVGIAAFTVGWVPLCIMLGYLGFIIAYLSGYITMKPINMQTLIFAVTGFGGFLSLVVLILGVIALFQKDQKKIFAVLGIALSLLGFILAVICFFSIFLFTGG